MLKKIARVIEDTLDDIGYVVRRSMKFTLGKSSGQIAGFLAAALIGSIAGFGEGADLITKYSIAVAAVAGVSAYLVQEDFLHKNNVLLDRYREEIASLLHKAPDKVQQQDMELVARGDFKQGIAANPALRKELKNNWLNRNVGVILSSVVSALTFLGVHEIDKVFGQTYGGVEALTNKDLVGFLTSKADSLSHMGQLALAMGKNGLIALGMYHGMKIPAHWVAAEVLGIDEHTVNDHVTEIKRTLGHGKQVTPEQVLATFIHAHHDIDAQVKAEYGETFDNMSKAKQHQLLEVVGKYMDVQSVADDLNNGRMRPEELAFAAFGQSSGIGIADKGRYVHTGNVVDGMWKGLKSLTSGWSKTADSAEQVSQVSQDITGQMPGTTKLTVHTPDNNHASMQLHNEYEQPGRSASFVARIGRSLEPSDDGLSHVERLEQSARHQITVSPA